MRPVASASTVRCDFIFWDWKEQPDFKWVEGSVNLLLSTGASRIYLTMAETTDDSYCLVVSDSELSAAEASAALEDRDGEIDDHPQPVDPEPFIWHRR
jgi:hypothetical protein